MKAGIIGTDGSSKGHVELPKEFDAEYKPGLIKRAVLSMQAAKKQPKGNSIRAGLQNTATFIGIREPPTPKRSNNTGNARLPRLKNRRVLLSGRVARVPQAVGGKRAHGPKAWKNYKEKINKKERKAALESAIATTTNKELVRKRFIFDGNLPLVIDDSFEGTDKTKKVAETFGKIGLGKDLENAKGKIRRRAGKGKARGRKKKVKKSVLIVTGKNDKLLRAARNLPGVDAITVKSLNVEALAPGGESGRLVLWTKSAVEGISKKKEQGKKEEGKVKKKKGAEAKKDLRKGKKEKRKAKEARKKKSAENKKSEGEE